MISERVLYKAKLDAEGKSMAEYTFEIMMDVLIENIYRSEDLMDKSTYPRIINSFFNHKKFDYPVHLMSEEEMNMYQSSLNRIIDYIKDNRLLDEYNG